MHHTLHRDHAGKGARIAQDDICIRTLHGATKSESNGAERAPAELKALDSTRRRPDLGLMTFDQSKARAQTRLAGEYSSLHRPRHHAAPDFSRSAPTLGFSTSHQV